MTDPRREGEGRGPKTTVTPKTDPDTGAGHRPSTTQPDRSRQARPQSDPTPDRAADARPPAAPHERIRPTG
jgi:hypothetical protein